MKNTQVDWLSEFKRADKGRVYLYNLIKSIQWAGARKDEGGNDTRSCKVCGGIDPKDPFASGWTNIGHSPDCWLGNILKLADFK